MLYRQEIECCFRAAIGPGGIERAEFDQLIAEGHNAVRGLTKARAEGSLALLNLPETREDFAAFAPVAHRLKSQFERIVVLGTGGSSLGGLALTALKDQADADKLKPSLVFEDNLDAERLGRLAASDLATTAFLVVSKSGATAETMAQTLVLLAAPGINAAAQFVFVTEPNDSPLRRLADRHGIEVLDHPPIGGRYSVLSVVGLLPALIMGLDIERVRLGALAVLEALEEDRSEPLLGAALQVAAARRGVHASVLMPYDSRLEPFGRWHAQLWAESLGKKGRGMLPVRALGPVDQHSQLQLYLDGPKNTIFTLILPEQWGAGPVIDLAPAGFDPELEYLNGRCVGDLVAAMGRATADSLAARGRPTRIMRVLRLDEETMGALFMHFMLETIIAARLIGVDPFDQPAVEEGKRLTREHLRRLSRAKV
jgi:glucose-6-phosphate isomerase